MKSIARVVAEGTNRGAFLASGCCGRVYEHGANRVYKTAFLDGTSVWLDRCFAIQKRLGIEHPLCEFMPLIFEFRKDVVKKAYTVVMERYMRIHDCHDEQNAALGLPTYNDIPQYWNSEQTAAASRLAKRIKRQCGDVIGIDNANDLHGGNVLWCKRTNRWVAIDPSSLSYSVVSAHQQDPKFSRAKRVVTQYGPKRRH